MSAQNVVIGEDTGKKLKTEVIDKIHVAEIVKYCMLAVGAVVVLTGCLLLAVFIFRRRFRSVNSFYHFVCWLSVFCRIVSSSYNSGVSYARYTRITHDQADDNYKSLDLERLRTSAAIHVRWN